MNLDLSDATALVTGASSGIGAAVVVALAREGVRVVAAARRTSVLRQQAEEHRLGTSVIVEPYDAMQPGAGPRLAAVAAEQLGRITILVNAAGAASRLDLASPAQLWHDSMQLNFTSTRELTTPIALAMASAGHGRIINLVGSTEPPAGSGGAAAKAAVQAWSKSLSRELGPDGVTVNCVQPGRIRSAQVSKMFPTGSDEQVEIDRMDIPLRRFGDPSEVAGVIVFLASEQARYVSGAVVPVDGGMRRSAF